MQPCSEKHGRVAADALCSAEDHATEGGVGGGREREREREREKEREPYRGREGLVFRVRQVPRLLVMPTTILEVSTRDEDPDAFNSTIPTK